MATGTIKQGLDNRVSEIESKLPYSNNINIVGVATSSSTYGFSISNLNTENVGLSVFYFDNQGRIAIITRGASASSAVITVLHGDPFLGTASDAHSIQLRVGQNVRACFIISSVYIDKISVVPYSY